MYENVIKKYVKTLFKEREKWYFTLRTRAFSYNRMRMPFFNLIAIVMIK